MCVVAVVVVVRISLSHPHEYKEAEEIRAKMEREGGWTEGEGEEEDRLKSFRTQLAYHIIPCSKSVLYICSLLISFYILGNKR